MICVDYRCCHYGKQIPEDACECMPIIPITDEMVERAARAFEGDEPFERYDAHTRQESLDDARRALAAALHWKDREETQDA